VPSGNRDPRPPAGLTLPRGGQAPREAFLVLPGLNLHPHRLDPLAELLNEAGLATVTPRLTGFAAPGDPALRRVRAAQWVADVEAAWRSAEARLPGARPSLLGYSLGALLGLAWALQSGVPLRRAILLAPALRLRRLHRTLIALLGLALPNRLRLPSRAPATYRFHPGTTVAAYRALAALERSLRPHLLAWLRGEPAGLPPLLIACSARDELVDTRALGALAHAWPARVTLMPLSHEPRRGFPAHLGLDGYTLGEGEWQRLAGAIADWLHRDPDAPAEAAAGAAVSVGGPGAQPGP
jgi:hypothetical protein